MATESLASTALPMDLVDEANMLCAQSNAVLECLNDGIEHLDSPEYVVPNITWLVRNHIDR